MAFTTYQNTPISEGAAYVLNSGGIALAAGFRVAMGDGTASALHLSADGVGVVSGANFTHKLTSEATADRVLALPDWAGKLWPETISVLALDVANSTTTLAPVTGLEATLEAGALYEFEGILICQSAAATTGIQIALTGPTAQVAHVAYEWDQAKATGLNTNNRWTQMFNDFGTPVDYNTAAAANTNILTRVQGILRTTTTPTLPLGFSLRSEVGGSEVKVKADSFLRWRRIK